MFVSAKHESGVIYTADAFAALAKNPDDRSEQVKTLIEGLGGQLIGVWYSFGEYDGVLLYEVPNNSTAATAVVAAALAGHLKATKTTVLMTGNEAMAAMGRAGSVIYRPPEG